MSKTNNHYTFGTNDTAAQRLTYLAAAYERPSRDFLREWAPDTSEHALDLGCGPGFTTELVRATVRARRTTGVDASERLLEQARARVPNAVFVCHDITAAPFPWPPADFLFCRFLITHLHDPGGTLRVWAAASRPGARLLIQETASLESPEPIFQRYYELLARVQACYGQSLTIGRDLDRLVAAHGWTIVASDLKPVVQAPQVMARLHAMNLRTWGCDEVVRRRFDPEEVARLQRELDCIAAGEREVSPVCNLLRQLVVSRLPAVSDGRFCLGR